MIQGIVIPCLTLFIITANCLPANEIGERQMSGSGNRNCVCMNWRFCDGKINSDVQCPGNYVNVCCSRSAGRGVRYPVT
ncbi:unnamed protein product [Callosobruchus maculatus]|uniref:Uncharacterized protein n=1 Tax=Callosobruchus maculatus TaxID=64391 RepID=A0A653D9I1_CALMS|nr:unnamed protein product [Callosobruchus maculatus]